MLNLSLAIALLSVPSAVAPVVNLPHLHPHMPALDTRVSVQLENKTLGFIDVTVGGHAYTVMSHHHLVIKAPAGTPIYSSSTTYTLRPGQLIATLDAGMNGSQILVQ